MYPGDPELKSALFLNAAALVLMTLVLGLLRRFLHWLSPPWLLHGYLPLALAVLVIGLLLSFLALRDGRQAQRVEDPSLLAPVSVTWSWLNLALGGYSALKALYGILSGL